MGHIYKSVDLHCVNFVMSGWFKSPKRHSGIIDHLHQPWCQQTVQLQLYQNFSFKHLLRLRPLACLLPSVWAHYHYEWHVPTHFCLACWMVEAILSATWVYIIASADTGACWVTEPIKSVYVATPCTIRCQSNAKFARKQQSAPIAYFSYVMYFWLFFFVSANHFQNKMNAWFCGYKSWPTTFWQGSNSSEDEKVNKIN